MATYKWRPSKSARREFAMNMQNPEFAAAYEARKKAREDKRRAGSQFDYRTAGGSYVPTKAQYDFCLYHYDMFETREQQQAANEVICGYNSSMKINHDYIHIVNEIIRSNWS